MKTVTSYVVILSVIIISACAPQQKTAVTPDRDPQEQERDSSKAYTFGNITVQGYMDNPPIPTAKEQNLTLSGLMGSRRSTTSTERKHTQPHIYTVHTESTSAIQHTTEEYDRIYENPFLECMENPISTFSIDVDGASYANARRFITGNRLPPADAVRIEEFINYFNYHYPSPEDSIPFSFHTERSECPWNSENSILKIGMQARDIEMDSLAPVNLVFLLDVSGSMNSYNKLPLLKKAFRLLVDQLRPQDKVSIVVYAGAAGQVLPPTAGNEKGTILSALNQLQAGGSTAGGDGINLAYKIAEENLVENGTNRVILATDGDFNVGISSDGELLRLIEEKRNRGVFLTVLGFGDGNYKDSKMENLSNTGNGNYAYIDNILEAKKVLVHEIGGTLHTIAKDVKIQIAFNPLHVESYRLIGYENRILRTEDFDDDEKDAGELGAGHTVTALYEIVPSDTSAQTNVSSRYLETRVNIADSSQGEFGFLKLRYKYPDDSVSNRIESPIIDSSVEFDDTSDDFRFACAVAGFGMLLRDSEHRGTADYPGIKELAREALGRDSEGYRKEFLTLVEKAELLQ
ncbi:MAG: vWA domain-containing protein [Fibrobacterota bacterium]